MDLQRAVQTARTCTKLHKLLAPSLRCEPAVAVSPLMPIYTCSAVELYVSMRENSGLGWYLVTITASTHLLASSCWVQLHVAMRELSEACQRAAHRLCQLAPS
jgi:hypothetical protein